MSLIHRPKLSDLLPPAFRGVRHCDVQDAAEWADTSARRMAQLERAIGPKAASFLVSLFEGRQGRLAGAIQGVRPVEGTAEPLEARVRGAVNAALPGFSRRHLNTVVAAVMEQMGSTPTSGDPYAQRCEAFAGDSVHESDPGCKERQVCGADVLPIRTRGVSGWPLAGSASGFAQQNYNASPTEDSLVPTAFWFRGFDSANAWALILTELVQVKIGSTDQNLNAGLSSQLYDDITVLVPVQWDRITPQLPAVLTFGHPFAAGVTLQVYGAIWGFPNE